MPEDLSHLFSQLIEEWIAMVNEEVEAKEIVEDIPVVMSTDDIRLPQFGRAIISGFEFMEPTLEQGVSQGSVLSSLLMNRGRLGRSVPGPDGFSMNHLAMIEFQG